MCVCVCFGWDTQNVTIIGVRSVVLGAKSFPLYPAHTSMNGIECVHVHRSISINKRQYQMWTFRKSLKWFLRISGRSILHASQMSLPLSLFSRVRWRWSLVCIVQTDDWMLFTGLGGTGRRQSHVSQISYRVKRVWNFTRQFYENKMFPFAFYSIKGYLSILRNLFYLNKYSVSRKIMRLID